MKTEFRVFGVVALFLLIITFVYGYWTDTASGGHIEWIGTIALLLAFGLTGMMSAFFYVVSRRIDPRPEDRDDAEIAEGAGEIGFFSPGSYWPFGLALAVVTTGIGLVYFQLWLIAFGAIAVLAGVAGLLFEYYTGTRREAD